MLLATGLKKAYTSQLLFEDVSFTVNRRERVGLVGRNGHGKSTLFRIILGSEHADSGNISLPKGYTVGHLTQHISFSCPDVLSECCLALPIHEGAWQETYKAEAMLQGLGFSADDIAGPPSRLSGGFQIRLQLAKLLLSEPNLLLLDEPTNYLDIVSIRWLARFLRNWEGEMMLITHDREFMDSVCTHTLGIHRGKVRKVEGSTEKLYELIAQEEELYEKTRVGEEKRRKQAEQFIDRFRAKASKARAVQSRVKQLAKIDTKEKLSEIQTLDFEFRNAPFPGKWLLTSKDVTFGFDADQPLIRDLSLSVGKNDRIAIIGPNGRGKTTLLNLLAQEFQPNRGEVTVNSNTRLGYFGQTNIDRLNSQNTVEAEVGSVDPEKHRTIIRSICGAMMFEGDSALKKISVLSGGERSRVLLGKILMTPANLLLLDEPTNHLDMYSIDSLLDAIDNFEGALLIVTHSELILHRVANRLVVFDRGEASVFEGSYQDFLDRVGWSSEDDENDRPSASTKSKKDQRKERAELQKLLAPYKKKVSSLEEKIIEAEARANALNQQLMEVSASQDGETISKISKDLHQTGRKISELFEQLEKASKELERKEVEIQNS